MCYIYRISFKKNIVEHQTWGRLFIHVYLSWNFHYFFFFQMPLSNAESFEALNYSDIVGWDYLPSYKNIQVYDTLWYSLLVISLPIPFQCIVCLWIQVWWPRGYDSRSIYLTFFQFIIQKKRLVIPYYATVLQKWANICQ